MCLGYALSRYISTGSFSPHISSSSAYLIWHAQIIFGHTHPPLIIYILVAPQIFVLTTIQSRKVLHLHSTWSVGRSIGRPSIISIVIHRSIDPPSSGRSFPDFLCLCSCLPWSIRIIIIIIYLGLCWEVSSSSYALSLISSCLSSYRN